MSEIYFPAADSPLESAMLPRLVSQREATVPASSQSTNLGHCQENLEPKEGNAVSYHKKKSGWCRCFLCALLCKSVLTKGAQRSLHQTTDVNFHPQFKLHTGLKSMAKCRPRSNTLALEKLCVTPVLTLLTTSIILYKPFQRVSLMLNHYRTGVTWGI